MVPLGYHADPRPHVVWEARRRLQDHLVAKGLVVGAGKYGMVFQRHLRKFIEIVEKEIRNDPGKDRTLQVTYQKSFRRTDTRRSSTRVKEYVRPRATNFGR